MSVPNAKASVHTSRYISVCKCVHIDSSLQSAAETGHWSMFQSVLYNYAFDLKEKNLLRDRTFQMMQRYTCEACAGILSCGVIKRQKSKIFVGTVEP